MGGGSNASTNVAQPAQAPQRRGFLGGLFNRNKMDPMQPYAPGENRVSTSTFLTMKHVFSNSIVKFYRLLSRP